MGFPCVTTRMELHIPYIDICAGLRPLSACIEHNPNPCPMAPFSHGIPIVRWSPDRPKVRFHWGRTQRLLNAGPIYGETWHGFPAIARQLQSLSHGVLVETPNSSIHSALTLPPLFQPADLAVRFLAGHDFPNTAASVGFDVANRNQ